MKEQQALQSLTAELVTAQDQLLALYELSNVMRRQTRLDHALLQLVRLTCRTMLANWCAAKLRLPGERVVFVQYPVPTAETGAHESWFEEEPEGERWQIRDGGVQQDNVLLLPLTFEEGMAGLLVCVRSGGNPFGSPEGKLGQALATQAAAFLENMILNEIRLENAALRAELQVASEVQTSLLPKHLPAVHGVELWGTSQPAKDVGGDFFDVRVQDGGTLLFCVGDVSGKGMPAALLMAMLLMVLRGEQRTSRRVDPAALLEHLYRAAYDELTASSMFATLFLGSYDPQTRLLTYANGGHSPVILRKRGRPAALLEAGSMPVGIFADAEAENEALTLEPGDVLLIGSDGLNEARNTAGELFSIERLLAALDRLAEEPATEIGRSLVSSVAEFSHEEPQSDDQTLLLLKGIG